MIIGFLFSIAANLLWGLIFIGPLLIPEYPGVLQATGRYIAFGIIALPLSWYDRNQLYKLSYADWIEAIKLVLVGNLVYYTCLTNSIQRAGSLISTIIIGTLPAVLAITANITCIYSENKLPWSILFTGLILIIIGLVCVNIEELKYNETNNTVSYWRYITGIILAFISVISWTWYALRNAKWLKEHPKSKSMTWAIAQGIILLPISCVIYFITYLLFIFNNSDFSLPLGPQPKLFVLLMFILGFFCSWLGSVFWNEASRRLPTVFMGPLIVFESVFGLLYIFIYKQQWPSFLTLFGILFLMIGVIYITNIKLHLIKKIFFMRD